MTFTRTISKPPLKAARFLSFLFTIVMWLAPSLAVCQNLVPNGSIEEGVDGGCPTYIGFFDVECADWYASIQDPDLEWEELPTPDWYHTCSDIDDLSPPNVAFGYQVPYEGEGYAGIVTYNSNVNSIPELENYREHIGVELTAPLVLGETYLINYYVARLYGEGASFATDGLGFKFTTYPYFESAATATNNFAHFSIDTLLSDTGNWIEISKEFIADSVYAYFHIGNFYDDANTNFVQQHENGVFAYYIIDGVSITTTSASSHLEKNERIWIYPNPFTNEMNLRLPYNKKIETLKIYSLQGTQLIVRTNVNNTVIKLTGQSISDLSPGMYSLHISTSKHEYHEKILKLK